MAKKKISKAKMVKKKIAKSTTGNTIQQASFIPALEKIVLSKPSKPEPKNKLVLEYVIYASQKLLYEFISSPSGLAEWFADDVNMAGKVYTFIWDGSKQQADVINIVEEKSIRLHWTDRPADTYFEFRIEKNELTHELSLIITDFAESDEDKNSLEVLWQGQVQRLMKVIGSKA